MRCIHLSATATVSPNSAVNIPANRCAVCSSKGLAKRLWAFPLPTPEYGALCAYTPTFPRFATPLEGGQVESPVAAFTVGNGSFNGPEPQEAATASHLEALAKGGVMQRSAHPTSVYHRTRRRSGSDGRTRW